MASAAVSKKAKVGTTLMAVGFTLIVVSALIQVVALGGVGLVLLAASIPFSLQTANAYQEDINRLAAKNTGVSG